MSMNEAPVKFGPIEDAILKCYFYFKNLNFNTYNQIYLCKGINIILARSYFAVALKYCYC